MNRKLVQDGERVLPDKIGSVEEYLGYLRHRFAYEYVRDLLPAGLEWLEIGSGEGYGTDLVSSKASSIIGIDVDGGAVAHASKKYTSDSCSFKVYDGIKLPFESASLDVVISFQVIEHVEDDNGFVAEAIRVLKPGGRFILTTPNRTYRLLPGQKPWNRYHIREYYPEELCSLLSVHFSNVTLMAVKGKGEVQQMELAAVKRGFHDLDKLNLRRLIPSRMKPGLAGFVRRIIGRNLDTANLQDAYEKYSTADYFLIQDNLEEGLDLLGVCVMS